MADAPPVPDAAHSTVLAEDDEHILSVECVVCGKWRATTRAHRDFVRALPPGDNTGQICCEIPMMTLDMPVYYACLYPEEKFIGEDGEYERVIRRPMPWREVWGDERRADLDPPDLHPVHDDAGQGDGVVPNFDVPVDDQLPGIMTRARTRQAAEEVAARQRQQEADRRALERARATERARNRPPPNVPTVVEPKAKAKPKARPRPAASPVLGSDPSDDEGGSQWSADMLDAAVADPRPRAAQLHVFARVQ